MTVSKEYVMGLLNHRFKGGKRTIEHWENFLLTDCTTFPQLPNGLVHPVALFHVPIQGVQTSIAELFDLGKVQGAGSVGLDKFDWEYFQPMKEETEYRCEGGVIDVERVETNPKKIYDRFVFSIELFDGEDLVARATSYWRLRRLNNEH